MAFKGRYLTQQPDQNNSLVSEEGETNFKQNQNANNLILQQSFQQLDAGYHFGQSQQGQQQQLIQQQMKSQYQKKLQQQQSMMFPQLNTSSRRYLADAMSPNVSNNSSLNQLQYYGYNHNTLLYQQPIMSPQNFLSSRQFFLDNQQFINNNNNLIQQQYTNQLCNNPNTILPDVANTQIRQLGPPIRIYDDFSIFSNQYQQQQLQRLNNNPLYYPSQSPLSYGNLRTEPTYGIKNTFYPQEATRLINYPQNDNTINISSQLKSQNYYTFDDQRNNNNNNQQIQIQQQSKILQQQQQQQQQINGQSQVQPKFEQSILLQPTNQQNQLPQITLSKPPPNNKLDNTVDQIVEITCRDQQQPILTKIQQNSYINEATNQQNNNNFPNDYIYSKQIEPNGTIYQQQQNNQSPAYFSPNEDTAVTRILVQYPINMDRKQFPPSRDPVPVRIVSTEKYVGFFYRFIPSNYYSQIIPVWMTDYKRQICMQFLIPMIIVLILHYIIRLIQLKVNDFCYLGKLCQCSKNASDSNQSEIGVLIWSFCRQMIVYKLGHLSYKRLIINNAQNKKDMSTENVMLYFFTVGMDFLYIFWIKDNSDIRFLTFTYIFGILVPIQVFHKKHYARSLYNARGLITYDLNYFLMFIIIYYVIPAIYNRIMDSYDQQFAIKLFIYIFPFIEWLLDIINDVILNWAYKGEIFLYQSQLVIIGLRVGILVQIDIDSPLFWYLLLSFFLKRINNSSQVINIHIKKFFFDSSPQRYKHLFSMQEIKENFKGKQGSYLENCIWLGMFYWYWGHEHLLAPISKNYRIVEDCQFNQSTFFKNIDWYIPFIIWIAFTGAEIVAIVINHNIRFDVIKWVGFKDVNLIDNVLIRMTGWYIFQVALMSPVILFPIKQ